MSSRTKVLHVLAPAREGGLERVVAMMAAEQLSDGVHIAAVLEPETQRGHPFTERLESLGIPVTPIVVGARSYLTEFRSLRGLIGRLQPAVVHTHGYRADIIASMAARAHGIAAVSTVHGFTGGSVRNRLNEMAQCFALRRSNAVIAVAAPIVGRLTAAGVAPSKIHCIPNGYAPSVTRVDRSAARKSLNLDDSHLHDSPLVAGWVGRLSPEKGADVMLQALSHTSPRWRLSIIGEGPERDRLQHLSRELGIEARVSWHGAVPNAGSLFAAFDAFVLTSRTEGTPISLFEAMDAGVPIVATSVGGVPDVISSAQGLLVPPERPRETAEALEEIERNPAAAVERSAKARQRLVNGFGTVEWLDAINATYRAAAVVSNRHH